MENQKQTKIESEMILDEKKIILVKKQWLDRYDHYSDSCYDTSYMNSEILGYFSNIDSAWEFINQRVKAKYGVFDDYVIGVIDLDLKSDNIEPTYEEEKSLENFKRIEEGERRKLLEEKTKAWKCSLCDQEFPNDDLINSRKKQHEAKHTRGLNYKDRSNGGGNNIIGKVTWEVIV